MSYLNDVLYALGQAATTGFNKYPTASELNLFISTLELNGFTIVRTK